MVFSSDDCSASSLSDDHLLVATVSGTNRIVCAYTISDCIYSTVNGSLLIATGADASDCPLSLLNGSDSSAPGSAPSATPFPLAYARFVYFQTLIQNSRFVLRIQINIDDSKIVWADTNLNQIPMHYSLKPGTLAAIAVTISTFLIVGAAAVIWYKRRHNRSRMRTPQPRAGSRLNHGSITPFALPIFNASSYTGNGRRQMITEKRNISASRPFAQRVLQGELDAAREKVVELEEQETRLAGSASESDVRQRQHSENVREAFESATQDNLAAQLQAARQEINLLVGRIDEMNADHEDGQAFGWGRSRRNGPPPEYV
ncbi:hypothetical protein R3P38DRAFT_3350012 [Favolaschia claudopus]|uniref:Uncharacterized protein n=1 Tax=Favolaschia claudopus TaxID=2862362 RepID=A0AAW0CME0_9AGAR